MSLSRTTLTGDAPGADLGPLISPAAKQKVLGLIQSGVDEGCDLLLDGRDLVVPGYEKGNFMGPTFLHNVKVGAPSRFTQLPSIKIFFRFMHFEWRTMVQDITSFN